MHYGSEYYNWLIEHYRVRLSEEKSIEGRSYLRSQIYFLSNKTNS